LNSKPPDFRNTLYTGWRARLRFMDTENEWVQQESLSEIQIGMSNAACSDNDARGAVDGWKIPLW
jgi:hypothetical protein